MGRRRAADPWTSLLALDAPPLPATAVRDALATRAATVPDAPGLDAWAAAVAGARDAARRRGEGCFVPADPGDPASADAWIDTGLGTLARREGEHEAAARLRAGDAAGAGALLAATDAASDVLAAVESARLASFVEVGAPVAVRVLVLRASLPAPLRDRFDGDVVDSADLPEALARDVVAAAPPPDVRVLVGDHRRALARLRDEGVVLDAVVEDPPYATGVAGLPYRDAWPEGAWSSLLHHHLRGLRDVLAPHAVIAVHVDEHRGAALETLLEATFPDGRLGTMIWDKRNPKGDATALAHRHERIEWACPDRAALRRRGGLTWPKANGARILAAAAALVAEAGGVDDDVRRAFRRWIDAAPGLSAGERAYRHLTEDGRVHRPVSMAWPGKLPAPAAYFEPLRHPVTGEPCPVPARGWRNPPATMARLVAEGLVAFGPDARTQPTRRTFLDEVLRERVPSVLASAASDDALLARMELRPFPYAKPVEVLARLLEAAAPATDAVVGDLFAGSGSTAHALLLRDGADGGARRCVLAEHDPGVVERHLLPRLHRLLARPPGPRRWQAVRVEALPRPPGRRGP